MTMSTPGALHRPGRSGPVTDLLAAASGRADLEDPVLPGTGGPAGNAQLTAWLGLVLLVLFLAELLTLLDLRGLVHWHIALGLLLIPPALAKTATTGWRMVRYYTHAAAYAHTMPPLLLRLLGPLVVLSTLGLLGTGTALALVGPDTGDRTLLRLLGQPVTPLSLHQAAFIAWAAATGVHVLARVLPALHLAASGTGSGPGALPGRRLRLGVLLGTAAAAATIAMIVLDATASWPTG